MIIYKTGNLLDASETYIAHGCNCQGKMGSGVALAIRERWPKVFEDYLEFDREVGLQPGDITVTQLDDDKYVVNMMTQKFYGHEDVYVDYDAIKTCFHRLNAILRSNDTVAIPKIGAGLGGGDWQVIEKIIEQEIPNHTVTVYVLYKDE